MSDENIPRTWHWERDEIRARAEREGQHASHWNSRTAESEWGGGIFEDYNSWEFFIIGKKDFPYLERTVMP